MRTITVPQQTYVEQIQSVNYQVGVYVDILIGVGNVVDGNFYFVIPQQFDDVKIVNSPEVINPETGDIMSPAINDFTDLMTQYPGGSFTSDDLWPYIDLIRSRR